MDQSAAILEALLRVEHKLDALMAVRARPRQRQSDDALLARVLSAFAAQWGEQTTGGNFTAGEGLVYLGGNHPQLMKTLARELGGDKRTLAWRFGNFLRRSNGRTASGMKLEKIGAHHGATLWSLKVVSAALETTQTPQRSCTARGRSPH